jgi:hypothetical protein
MAHPVVLALILSLGLIAGLVLTQEPRGPAVLAFVVALALAAGSLVTLLLLRRAEAGRSARARISRAQALRRGMGLGAVLGLIAGLQAIGGLTPLTALFVVLSFAIAEYVLTAGATSSR